MPRILALDWDRREARYVLATTAGGKLTVRAAAAVPLVDVVEGGGEPHPDLANSLRAALAREKSSRAVALVGVDRASIELLHFTLPPARDDELPELVLNQALRESQTVTEDSVIDFLPLDDNPAKPRSVTAAALSPEQLKQINATCSVAGVKPQRLLLRPYASASLFSQTAAETDEACLLINVVADEVDLTVLEEGKAIYSRTVRLPHLADPQQTHRRIVAEIRRTLAVALPSRLDEEPVQQVYVFGSLEEHEDLLQQIRDELSLRADALDPFEAVGAKSVSIPSHPGRFAGLLGMALDEAHDSHAIDFLHPRKKPKPLDRRRVAAVAVAAVAALAVGIGYYVSSTLAEVDGRNRDLEARLRHLNGLLQRTAKETQVYAAVRQWEARNVLWLEELRELSLILPGGQDMVIQRMSLSPAQTGNGGVIRLQGVVQDSSTVVRLEHGLRDGYHRIRSPSVSQHGQPPNETWSFDASVFVLKRHKGQYTRHLPSPPR